MLISVGICTWNRAPRLHRTLAEMCQLRIPAGVDWELLVANNNCTDHTSEVIHNYRDRLPIQEVIERTPGKSHALNAVVREVRGEYVIWTDDDVLVDPGWLAAYIEAFERWPKASVFGGPIAAHFDEPPPKWLQRTLQQVKAAYGIRDFGNQPRALSNEVVPFGANLAFRLAGQRRYLYDPMLGPNPNHIVQGGEETALVRRMLAEGETGRWVPEAKIRHVIAENEMTKQYLWTFYYRAGHGKVLSSANGDAKASTPSRLRAIRTMAKFRMLSWCSQPERWIEHLKLAAKTKGRLDGTGEREAGSGT